MSPPPSIADAGNQDAASWFAEEVQPHETSLRAWLRMKFPSLCDLDDVVQEAYLRIWRKRAAGGLRSPKGFLYTAAHNAACDVFRRQHTELMERGTDPALLGVPEDAPDAAEQVARRYEQAICTDAILSLPDRMRQVFTLRKIYGMSQKEISRELGISEHTVEAHIGEGARRCLKFVRAKGLKKP